MIATGGYSVAYGAGYLDLAFQKAVEGVSYYSADGLVWFFRITDYIFGEEFISQVAERVRNRRKRT